MGRGGGVLPIHRGRKARIALAVKKCQKGLFFDKNAILMRLFAKNVQKKRIKSKNVIKITFTQNWG